MTHTFKELGLGDRLLQTLDQLGFETPTPVQRAVIPLILSDNDVIGVAKTGSGKTAACILPISEKIDEKSKAIQAIIMVPTRELAIQYSLEAKRFLGSSKLKSFPVYGGVDIRMQTAKLKAGVQILVATPGRLIDLISSRKINLSQVKHLVLDEADEMLNMGFYEDLLYIMDCLVQEHQVLLFSATMPEGIKKIAVQHMVDPVHIEAEQEEIVPKKVRHIFDYCPYRQKDERILELIEKENPTQAIIFCQSRNKVDELARVMSRRLKGSEVEALHAGFNQRVRTRIIHKFRQQTVRFMVATDVAARGLDFTHVTHVFIYDIGREVEAYVHRAGRTGRSGKEGVSIAFATEKDRPLVKAIEKHIQRPLEWLNEMPPAKGKENSKASSGRKGRSGKPAPRRGQKRSEGSSEGSPRGRSKSREAFSEESSDAHEAPSRGRSKSRENASEDRSEGSGKREGFAKDRSRSGKPGFGKSGFGKPSRGRSDRSSGKFGSGKSSSGKSFGAKSARSKVSSRDGSARPAFKHRKGPSKKSSSKS